MREVACQLEQQPQPGGLCLGWGHQPTSPALRVVARVGRGQRRGQSDLLDRASLARAASAKGLHQLVGGPRFPWEARGTEDVALISTCLPNPPLACLKVLLESLPRFPHLSKRATSCSLLCLLVRLSGDGSCGREDRGILSLSSLTATIIIIWRDGPEVVRDAVGVNEMKRSSVCAVSPG